MIALRSLATALRRRVDLRREPEAPRPKVYPVARLGLEAAVRAGARATYRYTPVDPVYPTGVRQVVVGAVYRLRSTGRVYAHVWRAGRGWRTHRVDRCGPVTVVFGSRKLPIPPGFRRSYYSRVGTPLALRTP